VNKNNLCTIYVVRHAESGVNVKKEGGKAFDPTLEKTAGLTDKGRNQANILATKFKKIHFEAIFASDYPRAKETAEILKLKRNLMVQTTKAIRERQFGIWAGKWHLVKNKLQEQIKKLAEEEKKKFVFEDVETEEHAGERLNIFLREIAVAYPNKKILVVSHGNIMRSLLWKLGWATYHELYSGSVTNTGYFILESDGTDFFLKEVVGINKNHFDISTAKGT